MLFNSSRAIKYGVFKLLLLAWYTCLSFSVEHDAALHCAELSCAALRCLAGGGSVPYCCVMLRLCRAAGDELNRAAVLGKSLV